MLKSVIQYFWRQKKDRYLYTLGYQDLKLEDFVSRLKETNIKTLVDVREVAWSRKKGFSKSQLEETLRQNRINYIHVRELGSPRELRKKVKETSDYGSFFEGYTSYIATRKKELISLLEMVDKTVCCLMCFEKDVETCHRKIVASEVKRIDSNGLRVVHL